MPAEPPALHLAIPDHDAESAMGPGPPELVRNVEPAPPAAGRPKRRRGCGARTSPLLTSAPGVHGSAPSPEGPCGRKPTISTSDSRPRAPRLVSSGSLGGPLFESP